MEIKPQDIVVAIDLATARELPGTPSPIDSTLSSRAIAERLGLSLGAVSQSYKRLRALRLVVSDVGTSSGRFRANTTGLSEFISHGIKYYSHPEVVGVGPGMATGWSAPPLQGKSLMIPPETPYVWADSGASARGEQITPIHKSAVNLAKKNERAYMLLALIDVMRLGKYREQEIARMHLSDMLID